jgi:cytochrome b-561
MIFAFLFSQTMAVLSFRVNKYTMRASHLASKVLHGLWHTFAVGIMIAALVLIVQFHNDKGWTHLFSFHSWLGVVLILLYSQNYVLGLFSFALPKDNSPPLLAWARMYLPSHRFLGIATFFTSAVVMETVRVFVHVRWRRHTCVRA